MTGVPTCLPTFSAWPMKSVSSRRPKPPPSRWLWTVILSAPRPVIFTAVSTARVGTCVPTQISQASERTQTVQLTGSMVAWARNGCW